MRRCPVCHEILHRRIVEGVEADGCRCCGGVWLDAGELKALASTRQGLVGLDEAFPQISTPLGSLASSRRACPQCQTPLEPVEYDAFPGIRLDNCPECDGVWLDHGEATAIADRLIPVAAPVARASRRQESPGSADDDIPRAHPMGRRGAYRPDSLASGFQSALSMGDSIRIRQKLEVAELFGFETRNRYAILDQAGNPLGTAEEAVQGGALGFLGRQFVGHWRAYDICVRDETGCRYVLHHPFCFFLDDLVVTTGRGEILGRVERRFSILHKSFDIRDASGRVVMTVDSPFWTPWTFKFTKDGREVATIQKRWPGLFSFLFTDRDDFQIDLSGLETLEDRELVFGAALFIDLTFFERKAGR